MFVEQNNSRDPQRTPMQWSNGLNAGFSDSKNGTWLDVGPNFETINVKVCTGLFEKFIFFRLTI